MRKPGRVLFVPVEATDWVMAQENYVRIHAGSSSWLVRASIGDLEQQLDPAGFLRVHRSVIVNVARVRELVIDRSSWSLVLETGTALRCGRSYHSHVSRLLEGYL